MAHAAAIYGWNSVYNIDETSVRINNKSTKLLIGSEMKKIVSLLSV